MSFEHGAEQQQAGCSVSEDHQSYRMIGSVPSLALRGDMGALIPD